MFVCKLLVVLKTCSYVRSLFSKKRIIFSVHTLVLCGSLIFSPDIDECLLAAQNNTDLCDPMICSNTDGGFECVCPGGTEAVGGVCVPIGIVKVLCVYSIKIVIAINIDHQDDIGWGRRVAISLQLLLLCLRVDKHLHCSSERF